MFSSKHVEACWNMAVCSQNVPTDVSLQNAKFDAGNILSEFVSV